MAPPPPPPYISGTPDWQPVAETRSFVFKPDSGPFVRLTIEVDGEGNQTCKWEYDADW